MHGLYHNTWAARVEEAKECQQHPDKGKGTQGRCHECQVIVDADAELVALRKRVQEAETERDAQCEAKEAMIRSNCDLVARVEEAEGRTGYFRDRASTFLDRAMKAEAQVERLNAVIEWAKEYWANKVFSDAIERRRDLATK